MNEYYTIVWLKNATVLFTINDYSIFHVGDIDAFSKIDDCCSIIMRCVFMRLKIEMYI